MLKSEIPIDPMDGLPDVPAMVEQGMHIHEALAIWADFKTRHRPLSHPASQVHPQSSQEPC